MKTSPLHELAREAGLCVEWTNFAGEPKEVAPENLERVLGALGLPSRTKADIDESRERLRKEAAGAARDFAIVDAGVATPLAPGRGGKGSTAALLHLESGARQELRLRAERGRLVLPPLDEPGYHRLEIDGDVIEVAVAPPRSVLIEDIAPQGRIFGLAAQIYSLPAPQDQGFGDFGSLARFAEECARHGADALAVSPTHALFAADSSRYSPYAPSTRLFHNVLYADPAAIFQDAGTAYETGSEALIDWPRAGRAKLERLRALHERFKNNGAAAPREDFESFRAAGGELLEEHAVFEALHAHFLDREGASGWQGWPEAYHDRSGAAVAAFVRMNASEINFHVFLQWLADRSLRAAQARAKQAGMAVGLIADLAVGMDGGGSHAWSRPDDILSGLSVGAPPDLLGPHGQDWGLTTFSPRALKTHRFAPFLATMRAAMACAGGVRIDHVMGLTRLWVVPQGHSPEEGAYLSYPVKDMLRLVALESQRSGAIVIGEDLGTVPEGFREQLDEAGVLGMRVLWFEQGARGKFIAPRRWSRHAASMTTTHDLPTVAGWWRANDIDWRARAGQTKDAKTVEKQKKQREVERLRLWRACEAAGTAQGPPPPPDRAETVVDACIGYIARTPCVLAIAPIEDILGLVEQPNLPGTTDEHPNWCRRLPNADLSEAAAQRRLKALSRERPRKVEAPAPRRTRRAIEPKGQERPTP